MTTNKNDKLEPKLSVKSDEYRCELTKALDSLAKLTERNSYERFHHYILADNWFDTPHS